MRSRAWPVLLLALALTACNGDPEPSEPTPTPSEPSSTTAGPTDEPTTTDSPTASEEPAPLDWRPVPGPIEDAVTVSGAWSLTLPRSGDSAALDGPEPRTFRAPSGFRFTDALIDGDHAVVVAEHEQAVRPNRATVVDLATGKQTVIDGRSEIPTTVGGSWALGSGLLVHATTDGPDYCLAVADLVTGQSRRGPCVPPRHGVTNVTVTPAGIAAMTFDDNRPSCRTLNRVEGTSFVPLPGVEECRGFEAVVTENAALWGVVIEERRIEASDYLRRQRIGPDRARAGHDRLPDMVRRRGVRRARPPAQLRPGAAAADRSRRGDHGGGLRVRGHRPRVPLGPALRWHRPHPHRLHRRRRRAGDRVRSLAGGVPDFTPVVPSRPA